jgi:IS30 family transposase
MLYAEKCESRNSAAVTTAVKKALGTTAVRGITPDNGNGFARHRETEEHYNAPVFFADPRSPWQRGANENTNGLLCFFLPKVLASVRSFRKTVSLINNRPRKCRGGLSPVKFVSARRCT